MKNISVVLMNRERSLLGKQVTTSGEESLDPRFYINFYQFNLLKGSRGLTTN